LPADAPPTQPPLRLPWPLIRSLPNRRRSVRLWTRPGGPHPEVIPYRLLAKL